MKILLVGDPHVTPDSIQECGRLIDFVIETAKSRGISSVVILGDLHHTHSVVRVEVTHFWRQQIDKALANDLSLFLLVGNHDMSGNAKGDPEIHALVSYKDISNRVVVVESPTLAPMGPSVGFLPYYADPEKFVQDANSLASDILICHQTFTGAKFENSFPALDGVDPARINKTLILSGHIHMKQTLGKVIYTGSPRWIISSDANQQRGIHVFDTDSRLLEFISTASACKPLYSYEMSPDNLKFMDEVYDPEKMRVILTIRGPKRWVQEQVAQWASKGIELRTVYEDESTIAIKESEGLAVSLKKYVDSKEWDVPKEELWAQITQRIGWL